MGYMATLDLNAGRPDLYMLGANRLKPFFFSFTYIGLYGFLIGVGMSFMGSRYFEAQVLTTGPCWEGSQPSCSDKFKDTHL